MALITCHDCKTEISNEATSCPKCGATPKAASNKLKTTTSAILFIACAWFFFGGGLEKTAANNMSKIEQQVADDAVKQYEISKKNGNSIETCIHAGMVAAAYLQAKDENNHKQWQQTQRQDCKKAGMPAF
jgi:hypothetical protein